MTYEWCGLCRHYLKDFKCAAFPKGIPEEIFTWEYPHTNPHPLDGGIQFSPAPGIDPEYLRLRGLPTHA